MRLIKGGGGALTREKILAYNSVHRIIIVDEFKIKDSFKGSMLPVEILTFSYKATRKRIEDLGYRAILRGGENPFITDNGNFILDIQIEEDVEKIHSDLKSIPGVIETGFFQNLADIIIVGKKDGSIERISKIF